MKFFIMLAVLFVFGLNHAYADHHAVKVTKNESLGSFLTDTKGMTLYYFKKDAPDKSVCSGDCVTKWPVYYRETVAPKDGLKLEDFGVITREDGKKQSTYKRAPLYYFFKDIKAGDTFGQGVNSVWYVAAP
jgi:predicted lipoprotein with Yx(FWY)xxD motif